MIWIFAGLMSSIALTKRVKVLSLLRWGIPKEIEQSIISFLTEEMKEVVEEFYKRISIRF
jgi:hypothetical protein